MWVNNLAWLLAHTEPLVSGNNNMVIVRMMTMKWSQPLKGLKSTERYSIYMNYYNSSYGYETEAQSLSNLLNITQLKVVE